MPLRFCHRLQGDSRDEITFATLSAQRNGQELLLSLSCFETFPNPEDRFLIEFGEAEGVLSLSFSCSQAELPEGVVLTRDGGENLEGIFWGARVSVPLLLLGAAGGAAYFCSLPAGKGCFLPVSNGVGVIISHGEAPLQLLTECERAVPPMRRALRPSTPGDFPVAGKVTKGAPRAAPFGSPGFQQNFGT